MGKASNYYDPLRDKWVERHKASHSSLWSKHSDVLKWVANTFSPKQLAVGSLGGIMLLSAPSMAFLPSSHLLLGTEQAGRQINNDMFLIADLSKVVPQEVRVLTPEEEQAISGILSREFGFRVTAELNGKRLNRSYGYIGAEQHLALYPGDSISSHFDNSEEVSHFLDSGMAPGLGAWGYFANSRDSLIEKDKLREKYYIAVQTFLSADFMRKVGEYRDFFKYRKMIVVNPKNGKGIVVVVGDSGPAAWTGKQLGGSPEVMNYLERFDGSEIGPVLYFFVDDPNDTVPLGPVKI